MTTFRTAKKVSTFRQIAAAMWRAPNDPTIHGSLDFDATALLQFIEDYRKKYNVKITVTHVVAKAAAMTIAAHPEINAKIRYWGKIEERDSVDVFLQVSTGSGKDLSGARIDQADRKSMAEMADEIQRKAKKIRDGQDETYQKSRNILSNLPWWLVRPMIDVSDFLTNELHLDLPQLGLPRDPFGSAMVTSVGMFGIETAFAPFPPIARCPILIVVTEVKDRPWVVNGQLCVRPVLRLCSTFDHRVIDGYQGGVLSKKMQEFISHPERLESNIVDSEKKSRSTSTTATA